MSRLSRVVFATIIHVGCGGARPTTSEPATASSPDAQSAADPPRARAAATDAAVGTSEWMRDHFLLASQARDAVVRGRLEEAEAPLVWLGEHAAPKDMPASWAPGVERLQRAARAASHAKTLASAGEAVGMIAAECGTCHTALRGGPDLPPSDFNDLRTPSETQPLRERMHEQLWAVDRMWEGLVAPSEESWRAGAGSLGEMRGHPRVEAEKRARLERVRALGSSAAGQESSADRARVYGEILAECGSCHANSGVDPGAF